MYVQHRPMAAKSTFSKDHKRTKNEVDRGIAVETATSENPANVCSAQLCLKKSLLRGTMGHAS